MAAKGHRVPMERSNCACVGEPVFMSPATEADGHLTLVRRTLNYPGVVLIAASRPSSHNINNP